MDERLLLLKKKNLKLTQINQSAYVSINVTGGLQASARVEVLNNPVHDFTRQEAELVVKGH